MYLQVVHGAVSEKLTTFTNGLDLAHANHEREPIGKMNPRTIWISNPKCDTKKTGSQTHPNNEFQRINYAHQIKSSNKQTQFV